jgi:hypothetical protein
MSEQAGAQDAPRRTEFRVGDRVYEVRPFKGSKGVRAFAIGSRILEHGKALWEANARFVRDYREVNPLRITRDLANYRIAQQDSRIQDLERQYEREDYEELLKELGQEKLEGAEREKILADRRLAVEQMILASRATKADWERQLTGPLAEKDEIVVPQDPTWQVQIAALFPLLWKVAEPEMTMLLGLALIPDEEIKKARQEGEGGKPDDVIRRFGEDLLDELEIDEIGSMLLASLEVAAERYQSRSGDLGNRLAAFRARYLTAAEPKEEEKPSGVPDEPVVGGFEGMEDEEPPSESSDSSSTASDGPTDGPQSAPSSELSGATS